MTTTNEDLLALAKVICAAMTWPSDFGWDDQSDQYRAKCMDAARCVLVTVRQKPQHRKEVMPNDDNSSHIRPAVSPRVTAGAQAIRDKALDDAAQAASNRAAYFRDAAETASEAGFHALRAFHAMRELCLVEIAAAIRAMKGKPE